MSVAVLCDLVKNQVFRRQSYACELDWSPVFNLRILLAPRLRGVCSLPSGSTGGLSAC